ncbi:GNAT family N-acetyltransferase [Vibrio vulnificus]|uniref:GNAT family N-acetyltransferase n=1 Tax=Vibrio vulnificus TaxID=672 RepID=UPI000D3ED736|nr:GNAT family N-acetyltransferase [Vibrio vulnificus]MBN8142270.1 GNAT family N-acetyltransferase [Vibrio vulnificus]MBN8151584.1 GNAT family N-acetyltransferase [Vibrio vulnificus]MDS1872627.1 GNAT family N-acetyltransferase [Vibrio vulnificus]NIG90126.1 GNAT family N-acetyltransferase [Vibrio vulnificus]PUZ81189.1 GNAT family N-acetyltransferase [Vibrio vulnificus]
MSDIYLQLAVSEDVQLLQDSALAAFAADVEKYGAFPPNIESKEWFNSEVGKGNFYKVLCHSEFAGAICAECGDQSSIEIKYVYIAQKYQNKHIGSEVMHLIEIQYSHIKYWSLLTSYKSYRNHHFYEKLGYKKVGEFQPDASDEFMVFEYAKTLMC